MDLDNIIQNTKSMLFGMLGAVIVLILVHIIDKKPSQMVTVDITQLVNEFVKQELSKNQSKNLLKQKAKIFGDNLEQALKQFAKDNDMIVLPREAVIAGGTDYTEKFKNILSKKELR